MSDANWNNPTTTSTYTLVPDEIKDRDEDLALMFDGVTTTGTLPTNTIRWNSGNSRFEKWDSAAWQVLDSLYEININGNSLTATSATSATTATTSTNIAGGAVGAIPYQSGSGATALLGAGTAGSVLQANGAGAPTWLAQSSIAAGSATSATTATDTTSNTGSGSYVRSTSPVLNSGNALAATSTEINTVCDADTTATATTIVSGDRIPLNDVGTGMVMVDVDDLLTYMNGGLKTTIVEIGDWNMDVSPNISVVHGVTVANIREVQATIRNDAGTNVHRFPYHDSSGNLDGWITGMGTALNLYRATSGNFDNTSYDSTGYNRGWVIIRHV